MRYCTTRPVTVRSLRFFRVLPNPSLAIAVSGCSVFFHWYLPLQQFCQVRNVQMESKKADIAKNKHPVTMAELLVAHIQPWYRLHDWQRWQSAWAKPVMWYYYSSDVSDILILKTSQDEHHGFQSRPVMTTHHLCLQSSNFLQTFYILSLLLHT